MMIDLKKINNTSLLEFKKLYELYEQAFPEVERRNYDILLELVEKDLQEGFHNANAIASDNKDRGALRALTWCDKVTKILSSILTRYEKEGEAMFDNTGVYVCTICGYIYIGDKLPDVCPVCKVPNWKFEKVEGR